MSHIEDVQTRSRVKTKSADLLSKLPEDVRQKILECLPLKDAVRTSIFSTLWKYEWAKLPQIILDQQCFSNSETFVNIVNNVLLCHVGPLHKFVLDLPYRFANDENLCQWLRFVSRKSVSELTLICCHTSKMKLPSIVFSNAELTHLTLRWFKFSTLPPTFTGFPNLISLHLRTIESETRIFIARFIGSCPHLRFLQLSVFEDIKSLTIHAPKLEHLIVEGLLGGLCLGKNTTKIKTLHLNCVSVFCIRLVFSSQPDFHTLHLGPSFFKIFMDWNFIKQGLIDDFGQLETKTLELVGLPLQCPYINYFAVKLLHSYQSLQRLYCDVSEDDSCEGTKPPPGTNCNIPNIDLGNLPNLKHVEIVCVSGSSVELQFIKGILECASVLEVMTVKLSDKVKEDKGKLEIAMKLMQYSRASTNAQIIFKA